MLYRTFGRQAWKPSALGFGAMRLPLKEREDPSSIDEPEATRMIRYAIDRGVNYVDTAYPYHGGAGESFLGRCLAGGYREKVKVATKSPTWLLEKPGDFERYLDEQLERLQVEWVDFYLLHSLARDRWLNVKKAQALDAAEKALSDGKIKHLGFSFHDGFDLFKEIIDYYPGWEFCQIQYNYMDTDYQAGTRGLKYAAGKGLGVIVMEPIRGGALAVAPPAVRTVWERAPVKRSPAEWALQWVWNHPEVSIVLSGMSTMEQVKENVEAAGRSGPGHLTAEELELVEAAREEYRKLGWIMCTSCGYCMPCPNGVDIPTSFDAYNNAVTFSRHERYRKMYARWPEERRAGSCVECGECEEKCPQGLPIRDLLARVHEVLGAGLEEAREEKAAGGGGES